MEGAETLQLGESDVTLNKGTQYGEHSIVKCDFTHSEGSEPLDPALNHTAPFTFKVRSKHITERFY